MPVAGNKELYTCINSLVYINYIAHNYSANGKSEKCLKFKKIVTYMEKVYTIKWRQTHYIFNS